MKKRNLLLSAIAMLLVAVVGLTSASFAWFKFSTDTEVEGIRMDVKADKSLTISLAHNQIFKQKITFPELVKAGAANFHTPTSGKLDAATPDITTGAGKPIVVTSDRKLTFQSLNGTSNGLEANTENFLNVKVYLKATAADAAGVAVSLDTANLFTFDNTSVKNYRMKIVGTEVRYISTERNITAGDVYEYTLKPVVKGTKNTSNFYYTDDVDGTALTAAAYKVALKATDVVQTGETATLAVTLEETMVNSDLLKEIKRSLRIALICTPIDLKTGNVYQTTAPKLIVYEPDNQEPSIKGDLVLDPAAFPDYNHYAMQGAADLIPSTTKLSLFTITDEQIKADVCWEVNTYVWIEGFDTACSNYVTGSAFNTWLKFGA